MEKIKSKKKNTKKQIDKKVFQSVFSTPKSDADLKKIAIDLFDGKIFCDHQLSTGVSPLIVFMPLMFIHKKDGDLKKIGFIYEYLDKAMPRSVNGYPCFSSMRLLSIDETKRMFVYYDEYKALKEKFQKT